MSEPRRAPLVALVVRWAMHARREDVYVPSEVIDLLVLLAERHNRAEGCSRPGNAVLLRDAGVSSKDYLRKWLRVAAELGAIVYTPGRGRGHASEATFTAAVWEAPTLTRLAEQDAAEKGESARPFFVPEKGDAVSSFSPPEKGDGRAGKGRRTAPKRTTDGREKGDTVSSPTPVLRTTPSEPLLPGSPTARPAEASRSKRAKPSTTTTATATAAGKTLEVEVLSAGNPAPWSREACDDWQEATGGTVPGGRIGHELKPLVQAHGWDVVRPVWRRFLASKDGKYGPNYFASRFGLIAQGGDNPAARSARVLAEWGAGEGEAVPADPKAAAR